MKIEEIHKPKQRDIPSTLPRNLSLLFTRDNQRKKEKVCMMEQSKKKGAHDPHHLSLQ